MQLEDGNETDIGVYAHRTAHLCGDGCDKFVMRVALCIFILIMALFAGVGVSAVHDMIVDYLRYFW